MHLPGGVFFPFSRSAWFLPIARTTLCAMFDSQFTPNQQSVVKIKEKESKEKNRKAAAGTSEDDEDDGMDPMEAMRIWNEQKKQQ